VIRAVLEIGGVSKDYHGLRPLRIQQLTVSSVDRVAIVGVDRAPAEVFVNLVTGATLPDAGTVSVFGRPTAVISDSADWLSVADRFGIVSDRAVLLEQLSVIQNLALPFTLDIEPPSEEAQRRAAALASEVGLPEPSWSSAVAAIDGPAKARVRLARALALDPAVLLLEHASATLDAEAARRFGADVQSIASRRGIAVIALTADEAFARAAAARVVRLDAATGRLVDVGPGLFRRLLG
jgi:ABC-type polar amino acid transport system ATPase subunit